jgi:hypothetical protein
MANTEAKAIELIPSKAPNLLIAPTEYSQQYQDQMNNALRLYFNQIDNITQSVSQTAALVPDINSFPAGGIIMWSGATTAVPAGWHICDGTNGTPNLLDRFIVGAGSTYAVGATGGSANAVVVSHNHSASSSVSDPSHSHSVYDPSHNHTWVGGNPTDDSMGLPGGGLGGWALGSDPANNNNIYRSYNQGAYTGIGIYGAYTGISVSTTNTATGVSGTNANLPPYYALAYIMKL